MTLGLVDVFIAGTIMGALWTSAITDCGLGLTEDDIFRGILSNCCTLELWDVLSLISMVDCSDSLPSEALELRLLKHNRVGSASHISSATLVVVGRGIPNNS